MAQSSLAHVIEMIEELGIEELKQAQRAIEERLASDEKAAKMERFHAALIASGMVKEIKRPSARPAWEGPPITIEGEPLSETIIRERR